jgi:hypothetical protein
MMRADPQHSYDEKGWLRGTAFPGVVYRPIEGEKISAVWSLRNDNPAFRRFPCGRTVPSASMEATLGMSSLDYSERRPVSLWIGDCAIDNFDIFGVRLAAAYEGAE